MADNLTISTAGGTITLGTDEISSVHYQRNKLFFGVDGANDGDVSQTLPLPVSSALRTDVIQNAGSQLTPKFAIISGATSGDNTLVAAVASKKIRVLALHVTASGTAAATKIRFESGAGGTALTGQMDIAQYAGFTLPFNPVGWFETASGVLLNMELDAAEQTDGMLVYVEV